MRRVAPLPKEDRALYLSIEPIYAQATVDFAQNKFTQIQPLLAKALKTCRRLLSDDHPDTAISYNNLAANLSNQREYAQAQPLHEKALEINRRLLSDHHPNTAMSYHNLGSTLASQGKYAEAQPLFEKSLEIKRAMLTDDHPLTAITYVELASAAYAQGRFEQAERLYERRAIDPPPLPHRRTPTHRRYLQRPGNDPERPGKIRRGQIPMAKRREESRCGQAADRLLRTRARSFRGDHAAVLASVLARLGQPNEAWESLEKDLGRGLLDELAARQDKRLTRDERDRPRESTTALDRFDQLVQSTPRGLDEVQRAKRFGDLKGQRELASIALGEFQTKLVRDYGPLAGQVANLKEIQAALPADAGLITWVDIRYTGPGAADPDGEHWGVVVLRTRDTGVDRDHGERGGRPVDR